MMARPRYTEDTYQPVADAALKTPGGVCVLFSAPQNRTDARYWQQQFCRWRAQQGPGPYFSLTTRVRHASKEPEAWEVQILTHQTARAGLVVKSMATGEPINLDDYDEVMLARTMNLDDLGEVPALPPATDAELEALGPDVFAEGGQ